MVTASWSARSPVTKERSAGLSTAAAAVIHGLSLLRPQRPVMTTAKARTLAVTAASPGEAARMASRPARSVSASRPAWIMIQAVTPLTLGGAGAGSWMTAVPRKRTGQPRTCRQLPV